MPGAYDTVVWDWNGTLLDDVALCIEVANEILAELEAPALERARYREIFDFPVRLYYERAGVDLSRVDFPGLSRRFCDAFEARLHRAPLFPEAVSCLRGLRARGVRQFILSNTEHSALERMVARYGVEPHLDGVRGMEDTLAEGKLDGGRSLLAAEGAAPSRTLLVGDTIHDAEVARSLGIDCALVHRGHHSAARLAGTGAPVFSDLATLCEVLGSGASLVRRVGTDPPQ